MKIYTAKLIESLKDLSDVEFQRRVWVDGVGTEMSSFEELVSQIFDDTGLSSCIEHGTIADELGDDIASALLKLNSAVMEVDQSVPPSVLLVHPTMEKVRILAADALLKLGRRNVVNPSSESSRADNRQQSTEKRGQRS